jgi:hypothetical protein
MYESSEKRHGGRKMQGRRVPVTVYLDPYVYDALTEKAGRAERTLSDELRRAVRRHLKLERQPT